MTTIYLLTFKKTDEVHLYTSIAALCKANSHDKINVSIDRLYTVISKEGVYENSRVRVQKLKALSAKDIKEQL